MAEFRPVPEADRADLERLQRYAFAPELGPEMDPPSGEWPPTFYDQRGLYVDGTLVGSCKLYTHEARVRGAFHALGGLGAVAVAPEHRGQGYAREVCRRALLEYRERDVDLVALWPVSTPLYRGFGWATANHYTRFDCHPDALPGHDADGRVLELDADDWRRLRRVEAAYGEGTALSLRRSEAWWRERTLADWHGEGTPYCYGYERDGELRGYVIYTVEDDEAQTLSVQDLAHADEEAHRALLDFLGRHGAQIERVLLRRNPDADLLHRVDEPKDVECRLRTGPMVRLTDVAALEEFDWPSGELSCTLSVEDPLLEPNGGQFALELSGRGAHVTDADDDASADAAVDIGTLSQLAVGTHGVDAAERVAGLTVRGETVRDGLASVFTDQRVCLREFF